VRGWVVRRVYYYKWAGGKYNPTQDWRTNHNSHRCHCLSNGTKVKTLRISVSKYFYTCHTFVFVFFCLFNASVSKYRSRVLQKNIRVFFFICWNWTNFRLSTHISYAQIACRAGKTKNVIFCRWLDSRVLN